MPCPSLKQFLRTRTLVQKPRASGLGRVVVAAAALAFVLGAVAATAVRTVRSSGVHASDLHEMYTSAHEHEYVKMDKHGDLYVAYADDDDFPNVPDSGDFDEADGRKCKHDRDCETEWYDLVDSRYCQNWGDDPSFTSEKWQPGRRREVRGHSRRAGGLPLFQAAMENRASTPALAVRPRVASAARAQEERAPLRE